MNRSPILGALLRGPAAATISTVAAKSCNQNMKRIVFASSPVALQSFSSIDGDFMIRRGFAAASQQSQKQAQKEANRAAEESFDSLELTDEKINAITDKIPQRPVGVVEGASYTLLIIFAFGVLAFILYHVVTSLILEPTALKCFNAAIDRLKEDPRVSVRIGAPDEIRAWGSNSESRVARQQIPHQIYKDQNGVEHVRIQFYVRGPNGTGVVNADMYKDATGEWAYSYMLMDAYANGSQHPSRVNLI